MNLQDEIAVAEVHTAFDDTQRKISPAISRFIDDIVQRSDDVGKITFQSAGLWERTGARGYRLTVDAHICRSGKEIITYPYAFEAATTSADEENDDQFYLYFSLKNELNDKNVYREYNLFRVQNDLCFGVFGGGYLYGYLVRFKVERSQLRSLL